MPTIDRGGVRIHADVVDGAGTPVLLHTGGGGDSSMWHEAGYVRGLAGRPLILFDHRGRGASGRPSGIEAHLMEHYVEDVVAMVDHLGHDRFVFVGYSGGGEVGYALAARHEPRLAGLATIDAWDEPLGDAEETARFAEAVRADGMGRVVRGLQDEEPDLPEWFAAQMLATDPEMFATSLEAWARWQGSWTVAPRIRVPVVLVGAALDEGTAHAIEAFAARIPDHWLVVERGVGHAGLFARSDLVLGALEPFIGRFD